MLMQLPFEMSKYHRSCMVQKKGLYPLGPRGGYPPHRGVGALCGRDGCEGRCCCGVSQCEGDIPIGLAEG